MTLKKIKWLKAIAAALALVMTLGFAACDNGSDEDSSSSSDVSDSDEEQTVIHKVGYIFRESVSELTFTGQICEQRERASNRSSVETCYIDNVPLSQFEDAVVALSEAGCTDIVACSPTYLNVVNSSVAKKYMDLDFICFGDLSDSRNISAYSEAPYQGAYVAGLVASYNSKTKKIGVVADTALPGAYPVINAVQLGTLVVNDGGAEVYVAGAEKDNEIEQAINALLDNDCDVIVCYTNSGHSADYCQKKGVQFIGNLDYSDYENEYPNMLMYFYCRRDDYFLAQFKSMKLDTWIPDVFIGEMSNNVINVSNALPAAANGSQHLIDALVPHLTNGSAKVFKGPLKDTNGSTRYLETDVMTDKQIDAMDWYVQGVKRAGNFRQMVSDPPKSTLEIKS